MLKKALHDTKKSDGNGTRRRKLAGNKLRLDEKKMRLLDARHSRGKIGTRIGKLMRHSSIWLHKRMHDPMSPVGHQLVRFRLPEPTPIAELQQFQIETVSRHEDRPKENQHRQRRHRRGPPSISSLTSIVHHLYRLRTLLRPKSLLRHTRPGKRKSQGGLHRIDPILHRQTSIFGKSVSTRMSLPASTSHTLTRSTTPSPQRHKLQRGQIQRHRIRRPPSLQLNLTLGTQAVLLLMDSTHTSSTRHRHLHLKQPRRSITIPKTYPVETPHHWRRRATSLRKFPLADIA